jgi:ankyrin repeat protein
LVKVIQILIRKGVDINEQSSDRKYTALMDAAAYGSVDALNELLRLKANVNLTDSEGYNALHWTFKSISEKNKAIQKIQQKKDVSPSVKQSQIVKIDAVKEKIVSVALILCQIPGAHLSAQTQEEGNTPLHFALQFNGHQTNLAKNMENVVEALAKSDADVNLRNRQNQTPAMTAFYSDNSRGFVYLIMATQKPAREGLFSSGSKIDFTETIAIKRPQSGTSENTPKAMNIVELVKDFVMLCHS